MHHRTTQIETVPDFRVKTTLGVMLTGLFLLTPFSINNFLQGRLVLGIGSLAIVAILAVVAWNCSRGHHRPLLTFAALVPSVILFLLLAYRNQGMIGVLWSYPAVIAFYFVLTERQAWTANAALLGFAIPMAWQVVDHALAARVAATLLSVSIFAAIFVRVISNQQAQLAALATTDPLTGLPNRIRLDAHMEDAVQQHARTGSPMTLLALDLDHFKTINDNHGHDAGDDVLRAVGALLHSRMRRVDKVFRLGGEEFLALLYDTDLHDGSRVADTLRKVIAELPLLPDHPVAVSIGVAELQPGEDWKSWMKRSDENLYRAKADGRNRVVA